MTDAAFTPTGTPTVSLADPATLAQYLSDIGILDRRDAFKTLLQPFSAPLSATRNTMVLGQQGMGKTSLLSTLQRYINTHSPTTPVLWLSPETINDGPSLIDAFKNAWLLAAQNILNKALADINAINDPLGIIWSQTDLLRAITLMKLQTDVDTLAPQGEFLPRQRLANAIRSAIPKVKRLHFSAVNLGIRQLVERLQDPWLQIAAQIAHPTLAAPTALFGLPTTITSDDNEATPPEQNPDELAPPFSKVPQWPAMEAFCQWLDSQLTATSYRTLCLLDNWDTLATKNTAELPTALISFLNVLKGTRHQCVLTCRSEVLSTAFSGDVVPYFNAPLILSPLSPVAQQKLLYQTLGEFPPIGSTPAPTLSESAITRVLAIGQGNPHLIKTLGRLLAHHAQQRQVAHVDIASLATLGIETGDDITETLFSRVLLEHLPHEGNVLKAIASLLEFTHNTLTPFTLDDMVNRIHLSQQLGRVFVNSVLATLEREQFLTPVYDDTTPDAAMVISSRMFLAFLQQKTRWVETDLPCDEKLTYLKKVIPLAIEAGEFDAARTREAIALASSKGFDDLKPFLETALTQAVDASNPVPQRLTAMASLTSLGSAAALGTLLNLTEENSTPIIQEYALRHLKTWVNNQALPPNQTQQVLARLLELLDISPVEHRRLTYQTIAALSLDHGAKAVVSIYLKGLVDQDDTIRTIAITQLAHADLHSALVRQAVIDATQDSADTVRQQACRILNHNPHPKAMEALLNVLEHDPSSRLQQLAAHIIGQHPDAQTTQTLLSALTLSLDTDVHIAIVRSLRHHPANVVEPILHKAFQAAWQQRSTSSRLSGLVPTDGKNTHAPDELLWAYCQTLKEMAKQPATITTLQHALQQASDPILVTALESTIFAIQERQLGNTQAKPFSSPKQALPNPTEDEPVLTIGSAV